LRSGRFLRKRPIPSASRASSKFYRKRAKETLPTSDSWKRFLSEEQDSGGATWRIVHRSFGDFLGANDEVDIGQAHRCIRKFYLDNAKSWEDVDWSKVDDYGLLYLSFYLFEIRALPCLYDLICQPLMKEKLARFGRHRWFLHDVDLAMTVARSEKPPNRLQMARCSLIYGSLISTVVDVPPLIFGVMASKSKMYRLSGK
jgi:hypothetical protein